MKSATLILAALLLAGPAQLAQDVQKGLDVPFVVVDPLDLRQPVPDPEEGLTQKYDGKTVRFTGLLSNWGTADKKTYWYEMRSEIAAPQGAAKGNKETVSVTVYFQKDDRRLRNRQARLYLTVEGLGDIVGETLIIRAARVVAFEAAPKR